VDCSFDQHPVPRQRGRVLAPVQSSQQPQDAVPLGAGGSQHAGDLPHPAGHRLLDALEALVEFVQLTDEIVVPVLDRDAAQQGTDQPGGVPLAVQDEPRSPGSEHLPGIGNRDVDPQLSQDLGPQPADRPVVPVQSGELAEQRGVEAGDQPLRRQHRQVLTVEEPDLVLSGSDEYIPLLHAPSLRLGQPRSPRASLRWFPGPRDHRSRALDQEQRVRADGHR
jgi:hypothetical protein